MNFLATVADAMGGSILGGIKDLVRTFKLPPEKAIEAERAIAEQEAKLSMVVSQAASQAIQAEAKSGDAYVRRARPTFLYMCYVVLAFNYIAIPLIQLVNGEALSPINLPEPLFWLFGSGYLGYVGGRSWEKKGLSLWRLGK